MSNQIMIIEKTENKGIALTNDGRFISIVCVNECQVGDTVNLSDVKILNEKQRVSKIRPLAAIAALLIFTILTGSWAFILPVEAAVLVVDINPSIEIYLDNQARILRTEALNDDGAQILEQCPIKGLPLQEALPTVMQAIQSGGYLAPQEDDHLIVVGVVNEEDWRTRLRQVEPVNLEEISAQISQILSDDEVDSTIAVAPVTPQQFKQAKAQGVSVNKMIAVHQLEKMNINISLDQLKDKGLKEILQENEIPPGMLVSQAAHIRKVTREKEQENHNENQEKKGNQNKYSTNQNENQQGQSSEHRKKSQVPEQSPTSNPQEDHNTGNQMIPKQGQKRDEQVQKNTSAQEGQEGEVKTNSLSSPNADKHASEAPGQNKQPDQSKGSINSQADNNSDSKSNDKQNTNNSNSKLEPPGPSNGKSAQSEKDKPKPTNSGSTKSKTNPAQKKNK